MSIIKAHSDELRIFVQVVESGSFSRAAEQLGMDNAAVSRSIKKLEQKLGVNLLNRTTRQLNLTEEGARYFKRVQAILQEMAAAETEILANNQKPQGVLRIDSATPIILHLLVPLIDQFRQRYPDIELVLFSSENNINLIERKVDVAIRVGHLENSSLRVRHLFNSYRRIIASPSYLQKYGTPKSVAELQAHCCLGFEGISQHNQWVVANKFGVPLEIKPTIAANNGETLRALCLAGNGIACLSDFMLRDELEKGNLIELFAEQKLAIPIPFQAIYYSDSAVSSRIRAFLDFLVESLGK